MSRTNDNAKQQAIRTMIKANPPNRIEAALKEIGHLDHPKERARLIAAALFLGGVFYFSKGSLKTFLAAFCSLYFGSLVLIHYISLLYESKRVRKISRASGGTRLQIARTLKQVERG